MKKTLFKYEITMTKQKFELSNQRITCSHKASDIFRQILKQRIHRREFFIVMFLNRANNIIGYEEISVGGVSGTIVDPKLIFQTALYVCASGIIILHNHPSGNLKPSKADIAITKKINQGSELLEINLLDHLIVTDENYFSFADEGLI